ncbi:MAG: hypothetical protein ACFCU5_17660 [Pleurocapsa sp.]
MMNIKWSKLILKTIIWLSAEMYLTAIGLDNMADYGEFVQYKALVHIAQVSTHIGLLA